MTQTDNSFLESLRLRDVRPDELDKLLAFREECGWGADRLKKHFLNPDRPLFVLVANTPSGEEVDVGMGGLILEDDGAGTAMASKKDGLVELSSLFIRKQYQRGGLGTKAFKLLEDIAIDQYNAKFLTLDTAAYHITTSPDGYFIEDESKQSENSKMYERRGYVRFGEAARLYPNPPQPDIWSINMKKPVKQKQNGVNRASVTP